MEITLEKIELVKDRTGVSYAEAKEALEKADGSVVDDIILIEEQIDITPKTKAGDQASHVVEKIKELIRKGNVSKIKIKKGDEIIMNIPVNIGILGIVFVPWVTIFSVIAALGAKCSIELVKDNGDVVNISGKAAETFEEVKSNYSVIADDLKEKSGDALSQVKEKANSVINKMKKDPEEMEDDDYFNFDDFDDSAFDDEPIDVDLGEKFSGIKAGAAEKYDEVKDAVKEKAEQAADSVMEKAEDAAKKAEDLAEAAKERAREAADAVSDGIDQASEALKQKFDEAEEKFDETIEDYKAKKNRFRFFD